MLDLECQPLAMGMPAQQLVEAMQASREDMPMGALLGSAALPPPTFSPLLGRTLTIPG